MPEQTTDAPVTHYEAMGGHPFFDRLVHAFYREVDADPELRPMYPEADLAGAESRLRMFLEQYWGGPKTYQEQRGHPRLRMRHAPFRVTPRMAEHWLRHMRTALDEQQLAPDLDRALWDYFEHSATFMVNTLED